VTHTEPKPVATVASGLHTSCGTRKSEHQVRAPRESCMAEIRVQPKRRSMAWLWILLILVIAGAVAYFMFYSPNA